MPRPTLIPDFEQVGKVVLEIMKLITTGSAKNYHQMVHVAAVATVNKMLSRNLDEVTRRLVESKAEQLAKHFIDELKGDD